jgi:hypothetical protein
VNPITQRSWEGTGVRPDVEVPAALAPLTAHRLAQYRLEHTDDAEVKERLRKSIHDLEAQLERERTTGRTR